MLRAGRYSGAFSQGSSLSGHDGLLPPTFGNDGWTYLGLPFGSAPNRLSLRVYFHAAAAKLP